jgi:4-hydroxyphenylpyruvate dioxygenase
MPKLESLGITRIEALHYYVRDTRRTGRFLVDTLDFREVGGDNPSMVEKTRQRTTVFQAAAEGGGVRFLVSEPAGEGGRAKRFLSRHPEGIGSVIFGVRDAARAFELLESRGGTPLDDLQTFSEGGGTLKTFAIATPFGDTSFRFVERKGYQPFYPGFVSNPKLAADGNRHGFTEVDHLTSNFRSMSPTSLWLENVLGFEKFWEIKFHTRDMAPDRAEGSGLKSIVHKDPNSPVKFANNEPLRPHYRQSQIHIFDVDHGGDGVQHAALATPDLVKTVTHLQAAGAPFMSTPGPYYDALAERLQRAGVGTIDEDIDVLRKLHILVDGDRERKYLLQIFMQEMASIHKDPKAGPFFLELIQRKGDEGFGYGNFRALFESIERAQKHQGRI